MNYLLVGILFYVLVAVILYTEVFIGMGGPEKLGSEKFSFMTEKNHQVYMFFCSIWLFLVILTIYGKIKDLYVKCIRGGDVSRNGGGGV